MLSYLFLMLCLWCLTAVNIQEWVTSKDIETWISPGSFYFWLWPWMNHSLTLRKLFHPFLYPHIPTGYKIRWNLPILCCGVFSFMERKWVSDKTLWKLRCKYVVVTDQISPPVKYKVGDVHIKTTNCTVKKVLPRERSTKPRYFLSRMPLTEFQLQNWKYFA